MQYMPAKVLPVSNKMYNPCNLMQKRTFGFVFKNTTS